MRARPPLVAFVLAACLVACHGSVKVTAPYAPCIATSLTSVGERLPDCTFEGFPGMPALRLTDLEGKPAVVNFWASWCIECVGEMPGFQRVFQSLGGKLSFVGMNVLDLQGETKGAGETFAKRTGVHYILAFDPHGYLYAHFSASTARPVMPISVFIGPDLRVRQLHFGPLNPSELRDAIATAFGVR